MTTICSPEIIARCAAKHDEKWLIRPLQRGDFGCGFANVLAQLTSVEGLTEETFEQRLTEMRDNKGYHVIVVEEKATHEIVATATLHARLTFVHGPSQVGHIEDVVVLSRCRGNGLGRILMDTLRNVAHELKCYKVILDCAEKNVPFYENFGFQRKEIQMRWDP